MSHHMNHFLSHLGDFFTDLRSENCLELIMRHTSTIKCLKSAKHNTAKQAKKKVKLIN